MYMRRPVLQRTLRGNSQGNFTCEPRGTSELSHSDQMVLVVVRQEGWTALAVAKDSQGRVGKQLCKARDVNNDSDDDDEVSSEQVKQATSGLLKITEPAMEKIILMVVFSTISTQVPACLVLCSLQWRGWRR